MASFLSKFVSGAAEAGAGLYADRYSQNLKAELMAKRDAVLQKNRMSIEESRQAFDIKQTEAKRIARAESPRGKMDVLKLEEAEGMKVLKKAYNEADVGKRMEIVKKIMVANGKPLESITKGSVSKGTTLITAVFKSLTQQQNKKIENYELDRKDAKTTTELLEEAKHAVLGTEPPSSKVVETKVSQILADNPNEDPRDIFNAIIADPKMSKLDKDDARKRLAELTK